MDELWFGVGLPALLAVLILYLSHRLHEARRRADDARGVLESMLASSSVGTAFFDRGYRVIRVNAALAALHDLPLEAHIGRTPVEIFPRDGARVQETVRRVFARGMAEEGLDFQVPHPRNPSELRHFDASYFPVRSANSGQLLCVGMTVHDLTKVREAEEQARAGETRFRRVSDSIPHIVWTAEPRGDVDYLNRRWYEYTGFTPHEGDLAEWTMAWHPDDREKALADWFQALRTGTPVKLEFRLRDAQGSYRWHWGRGLPLRDADGVIVKWFGTVTDVQDQKEALEREGFLVQASHLLSSSLDYERTLRAVARLAVPRFADWSVVDLQDERGEVHRLAVAHRDPGFDALEREFLQYPPIHMPGGAVDAIRMGTPFWFPERTEADLELAKLPPRQRDLLHAFGMHSSVVVPLVAHERILGALTLMMGSSKRTYKQEDFRMAQMLADRAAVAIENARLYRDMRSAVRARDEFLALASHELKTPLQPLKIQLQGIKRLAERTVDPSLAGGRILHALDVACRQVQRIATLVDDLLDVSRIAAGQLRLSRESTEVLGLVREVVERFLPPLEVAGVRVRLELPTVGFEAFWDKLRMEQVLSNLLSNALKYATGHPLEIRLANDAEKAMIEVRDFGPGIRSEARDSIFQRFERADADASQISGLGLGLYISRQIIEAHGGRIWVESGGAGGGAAFKMELPLRHDVCSPSGATPQFAERCSAP
jgi:PAS domain S-box-containing protein